MRRAGILAAAFAAALGGCQTTSPTATGAVPTTPEESRLVGLARDIEARGDTGTAVALYARAAEASNGAPSALVRLGEAQVKAGDPAGAKESFKAALAKEPRNAHALLGLGTAELNEGSLDSASRNLGDAAPIIGTATAYNRLGTALVLNGRPTEAKAAFMKARTLEPGNVDIAANLALAMALAGDGEVAIATMRAAANSPAANGRHQRNLVVVLSLSGRFDDAAAVSTPDMSPKAKTELLAKAKALQAIKDPSEKARAVGLMASA